MIDTDVDSKTIQTTLLIKYTTDANVFFNNVLKEQTDELEKWEQAQRAH